MYIYTHTTHVLTLTPHIHTHSTHILTPTPHTHTHTPSTAVDSIISHPDEMDHLEQYRVLGDYQRKDSHQVDLYTGQLVHIIEKHDTGEWVEHVTIATYLDQFSFLFNSKFLCT